MLNYELKQGNGLSIIYNHDKKPIIQRIVCESHTSDTGGTFRSVTVVFENLTNEIQSKFQVVPGAEITKFLDTIRIPADLDINKIISFLNVVQAVDPIPADAYSKITIDFLSQQKTNEVQNMNIETSEVQNTNIEPINEVQNTEEISKMMFNLISYESSDWTSDFTSKIIKEGTLEKINFYLQKGANINFRDEYGYTPLMVALKHKAPKDLITFLIEAGAAVDVKNTEDRTTLMLVIPDSEELINILLPHCKDPNFINIQNSGLHNTALMIAAERGKSSTVQLLIEAGSNLEVKNRYHMTALHLAAKQDKKDNARLLIEAGADVNVKDHENITPLIHAVANGNLELVILLIKNGAKVNEAWENGNTALHEAVKNGFTELVPVLLDAGADINSIQNKRGETALGCAHKSKNMNIYKLLSQEVEGRRIKEMRNIEKTQDNSESTIDSQQIQCIRKILYDLLQESSQNINKDIVENLQLVTEKLSKLTNVDVEKKDVIENIRNYLLNILDNFSEKERAVLHQVLLQLAEFKPINTTDPITQDEISETPVTNRICVSTGYIFDIENLIKYHNNRAYDHKFLSEEHTKRYLQNPFNRQRFSKLDSYHIQKEAAKRGLNIANLHPKESIQQENNNNNNNNNNDNNDNNNNNNVLR